MRILIYSLFISSYFFLAQKASAFSICPKNGSNSYANLCDPQIGDIVGTLVSFFFMIAVVAALLYLIWGGIKWLTSGGDKAAVQGAREHIVAAVIGLMIVFLSYFILNLVVGFFLGNGVSLSNIKLPSLN